MAKTLNPSELAATINKKFGTGTMVLARDAVGLVKPRISTGSIALDLALGGGFPEGAIELMEGEEGVSKSWSLHTRAANFQKMYEDGWYILVNAEGTNDPPFLQMIGVDLDRCHIIQPDSGEQAWDVAHEIAKLSQKVYIGIDSLDTMVPLAEMEGEMDESKMAPAARMNNRGFRKLIGLMKSDVTTTEHRVTMGIITQLRTNIGVMFGDPNTSVGGRGKMYAAMTRIRYRKIKDLRKDGKTIIDKYVYGMEVEAEIKKNKGTGEGEKVRFTLYKRNHNGFKRGQIDNVSELIPFLLRYKIVEKAGAWYQLPDGGEKLQGEEKLAQYLREEDEWRDYLIDVLREKVAEEMAPEPVETPAKKAGVKTGAKKLRRSRK